MDSEVLFSPIPDPTFGTGIPSGANLKKGSFGISTIKREAGGPVKGRGQYLVGERGPEMFTPGVSGMITPNHALGGTTNVVVNVDASGSNVEGDEQQSRELGRLISVAVQSELIQQKKTRRITRIMATFPDIKPTYGQRKKSRPLTRIIRFADGYEHRILFGLAQHQNPKEFSFTFEVSETDADTIETFLDARANDSDSFTFTPPGREFIF